MSKASPVHALLQLVEQIRELGKEIYEWKSRPTLKEVREFSQRKGELLKVLDDRATAVLQAGHKAGIKYDAVEGRVRNAAAYCREWLGWAWRYRGKAPQMPTEEQLEDDDALEAWTAAKESEAEQEREELERELGQAKSQLLRMGTVMAMSGPITADKPDKKTDKKQKNLYSISKNLDVHELAKRIRQPKNAGRKKIEIAREITEGNEKKAQTLVRELRRFPHLLR
jgi:hypothetical protein